MPIVDDAEAQPSPSIDDGGDDIDLQDLDGTLDVDAMESGDLARKARKHRLELRAARHDGIVAKIAEMKAARVSRLQEKVAKTRLQQENKLRRVQKVKEAGKQKAALEKEKQEKEEKEAATLRETQEKEKKAKKRRLERPSASPDRTGKKAGRSRSASSSSSSSVASKASSAPSEGAMAIARALSHDPSLVALRTEQIEKVLAHQVPTEGQDPFAVVVDTEDAVALGQIMVAHSTHRAMSTLAPSVEVEQFLQLSQVDGEAAIKFRTLPYPCQKAIIDKGPIMGTRAPSSVLLARIQDIELGRTVVPERSSDGAGRSSRDAKEDGNARLPSMLDSQPASAMSRGYGNQPVDQTMRAVHMAFKKLF